jgi:hypothetical protein
VTDFLALDAAGAHWNIRRDDPDAAAIPFLQKVVDGAGDLLKEVRIKRLLRIRSGSRAYLVKHYRGAGFVHAIKNFWRGSPAFEEWEAAYEAIARGVATIPPALFGERGPDSWIAFHEHADLIPVDRYLRHKRVEVPSVGAHRHRIVRDWGRFSRRIHDTGLDQDDFDPNNCLFRTGPDGVVAFFLVDFERVTFGAPLDLARRTWVLAKMNRFEDATLTDRLRFLSGYCEAAPPMDLHGFAESILAEHRKVTLRDLVRGARGSTEESRNIGRMDTGYFRKRVLRESGEGLTDEQASVLRRAAPSLFGEPLAAGPEGCRVVRVTPGEDLALWRASNACLRAALPVLPPLAYGPGWVAFAGLGRDLPEALGSVRGQPEWGRILEALGRSAGLFERIGLDVPGPWPPDPLTVFWHKGRILFTPLGPLAEPTGALRPGWEERLGAVADVLVKRFGLTSGDRDRIDAGFRRTGGAGPAMAR